MRKIEKTAKFNNGCNESRCVVPRSAGRLFELSRSLAFGLIFLALAIYFIISFCLQIKTTSPENYRVRPSSGPISPGETAEINIFLQPGKDIIVFLVMNCLLRNKTVLIHDT